MRHLVRKVTSVAMTDIDAKGAAKAPRVGELIDHLADRIKSGRWPVGARLPVEAELMTEFDVSRVTLRHAVQALVHVGMLETIQGNGTFVRSTTELEKVLTRYLGTETVDSVLEVRAALEGEAAALAASRSTEADIIEVEQILSESRTALAAGDRTALESLSSRFHRAVVASAHNPVLSHLYEIIQQGTERTIVESPPDYVVFVPQHAAMLEAIRTGQPEEARALAREHLLPLVGIGTGW